MIKVAVTGGIGSGKSTVIGLIENEGYKCVSADGIYAEMLDDERFVENLSDYMNIVPKIVNGKKVLDRKKLADVVFNDKSKLKKLDEYTHPLIMNSLIKRMNSFVGEKIVFAEVPLLFEGGFESLFDCVIVVEREYESRVLSTMLRDGKTREEVERIIARQSVGKSAVDDKIFLVENNGSTEALFAAIKDLICKILETR